MRNSAKPRLSARGDGATRNMAAVEGRVVADGFFDGEVEVIVRFFREVGDVAIERRTKLRDFPHDAHGARGGLKEAEEGIHGGGFACAVLTDQSEEIALADFEIEAVKGVDLFAQQAAPEVHVDIFGGDHMPPMQKRLLRPVMISASDSLPKFSVAKACLMLEEVLQVHTWTFLSQPQEQSICKAMRLPRSSSSSFGNGLAGLGSGSQGRLLCEGLKVVRGGDAVGRLAMCRGLFFRDSSKATSALERAPTS